MCPNHRETSLFTVVSIGPMSVLLRRLSAVHKIRYREEQAEFHLAAAARITFQRLYTVCILSRSPTASHRRGYQNRRRFCR